MKRLIARIRALEDRITSGAAKAAAAGAESAAATARALAPVDSGALKNSIRAAEAHGGAVVRADAPHAVMVEFGTSKMPPRPFMRPAAVAAREIYTNEARRLIQGRDKT